MSRQPSRRTVIAGSAALGALATPLAAAQSAVPPALQPAVDYAKGQKTTGLLIVQDRKTLVEMNWPAPAGDTRFANFVYGAAPDGELLEDVASQQKSFVSMLVAVGVDKGLIDVSRTVTDYIGPGWSRAAPDQEAMIRLIDVLHMASGLRENFTYQAPPGALFFYNTAVYAITKRVVAAAAKQPLETVTHDWLTAPAGMSNTAWRRRPAAFADVGNPTGLVTCPRDVARFGQIVLDKGLSASGRRIVSEAAMKAMFERSPTNPSYGRLWWLNGGAYTVRPPEQRIDGPLIPAAPADLVAALGALGRKLYISPSKKLIVVRMGAAPLDAGFDQQLWLRLKDAIA